jgi:tRNA(Ile)-lysidine synthase
MKWEKERFTVISNVVETMRRWPMLERGGLVLVAVSGGADSLVLLDVMVQMMDDEGISLRVVHVDHGVRPGSRRDAAFVEEAAAHYGLECSIKKVEVSRRGMSPEEGMREARYGAFTEEIEESGAARLAMGHTADDRVETLLQRLIAGSGPRGLGAIPPVRGPYIRPLIRVWRNEVESYAPFLPFPPRLDETNLDMSIPRNRIRHRLVPMLENEFNPAARRVLLREAETLLDVAILQGELAEGEERDGLEWTERGVEMDLDWLLSLHTAIQREVIARCMRRLDLEVDYDLMEDILRKLPASEGGAGLDIGPGLAVYKVYGRIVIGPRPTGVALRETLIPGEGRYALPDLGMRLEVIFRPLGTSDPGKDSGGSTTAWLDADRLSFPLRVRGIRAGDRFHPLGAPGRRKMQDFLVDAKVPRRERGKVALLESAGEIAWVLGMRIDERFKVGNTTERIAVINLVPDDGGHA